MTALKCPRCDHPIHNGFNCVEDPKCRCDGHVEGLRCGVSLPSGGWCQSPRADGSVFCAAHKPPPDLSPEERAVVVELRDAVRAFGGGALLDRAAQLIEVMARERSRDRAARPQHLGTLEALRLANVERNDEWWRDSAGEKVKATITFRAAELAGEAGEACNVMKKIERERLGLNGSRATIENLADELADVAICDDLCAMGEDINLGAAIMRKFNETSAKLNLRTRIQIAPDGGYRVGKVGG